MRRVKVLKGSVSRSINERRIASGRAHDAPPPALRTGWGHAMIMGTWRSVLGMHASLSPLVSIRTDQSIPEGPCQ